MPSQSVTLPDIEQSVARPAIFEILNQIFTITNLSKDTKIIYRGHATAIQTPGTSIDDNSRDAKFAADRYTFVEVVEQYQPGALQETHVHSNEHAAVFLDKDLGLVLRPVYTTSDVTIQIRYRAPSEAEVKRWMAEMLMKTARGRDIDLHTVSYTYPLPYPLIELIEDVWTLREAVAGYGESFMDYITTHSSNRLTLLANRAGEMRHLAIKERQTRIEGLFDISGLPDAPTKDNASGAWEIAFGYKFSYQRPDGLFIKYPIAVHQQFLPTKYLDFLGTEEDPATRNHYYSQSYDALSAFEGDRGGRLGILSNPYIRIPNFDDHDLSNVPPGTATVLTAMCFVEPDGKTLLDLKDLGDYAIDSDVIAFMKSESVHLPHLYHSLIHVSVYADESQLLNDRFIVTPELVIMSVEPLDLRKTYRVRLSMVTNIHNAVRAAIDRLGKFPLAFTKVLSALNELLYVNPDFQALSRRNKIEAWELSYTYWILTGGAMNGYEDYPWNDILNNPSFDGRIGERFYGGIAKGTSSPIPGRSFVGSISKASLDDYFRTKRRMAPTVQYSAVIACNSPLKP